MSALAHDMGGALVTADWPSLTVEALAPVLERYAGLGAVERVAWHSQRPFAASAIVRCAREPVFVKRHDRRLRGVADLREEHDFIAHLRARGAAVPRVLAMADGATALAAADGTYEISELGEGEDIYRDTPSWMPARSAADAGAIGRALASLHRAAAGFDAPARRTRMLVGGDWLLRAPDPLEALEAWVAEDVRLAAALAERGWRADFARVLLPRYAAAGPATQAALWSHGDFHASNLLWLAGGVSALLDFGLANRASATWDLATAIERNAIAWLHLAGGVTDIGSADLACALLRGYAEISPLPPGLAAILPVVHVEFALSELSFFHGVTRSLANAEAAYTDFLLGHAAWFAGDHGRAFLDGVAACC